MSSTYLLIALDKQNGNDSPQSVGNIFRSTEKRIFLHVTNSVVVTDNKCNGQVETSAEKAHGRVAVETKIGRPKLCNL